MGTSQGTSGAIAIAVVAAVVVYAVSDSAVVGNVCYLGVVVGASIGAWLGAERAPPGHRSVPRLIAAGVTLTALGDVLWGVLELMGAHTAVSIADLPWFASYAFLCAALWVVLSRDRGVGHLDVDFVIDAATIVVVGVLLFWSVSIEAIVADQSLTPLEQTVWSAYPVADAVLLALVMRILISRSARRAIDASFAVGVCLWLAADIAHMHAPGTGASTVLMDAAWMIAPVLVARAAWRSPVPHPQVAGTPSVGGWGAQLTIAVVPLLVPPALELTSDLRGEPDRPLLLFTGSAALILLALARTARLLRSEELARKELEVARDAALGASKAKSMFMANVSHEIRTPLTTVLAAAEILEDTSLDDVQLNLLAKMHRSGELLKNLVEGLLDFSRVEAGRLELATTDFDLHAMVADTADVYVPRATNAGLRFVCHLDPRVPRIVTGDPGRLFQILTNLLDNALKFTLQGQVTLTVRPVRDDAESYSGMGLEFLVADTGIGIREEDIESVFESFSQVDGTTTRNYAGSGLGLAICKELSHLMGGTLNARSEFGAGATFILRLPLLGAAQDRTATRPVPSLSG